VEYHGLASGNSESSRKAKFISSFNYLWYIIQVIKQADLGHSRRQYLKSAVISALR